jgi:hypothetical protein
MMARVDRSGAWMLVATLILASLAGKVAPFSAHNSFRPNLNDVIRHDASKETTTTSNYHGTTKSASEHVLESCDLQSRKQLISTSIAGIAAGTAFVFLPQRANAERTLGTVTESYKRYVPRMEAGFLFLANDVQSLVESGDVDTLENELTAEKGTTISAMKGTMKIFATAFSDSVLSSTTREMQLADFKAREALDTLLQAAKAGDKDKALEAQKEAVYYAQVYSEIANASIPRSLPLIEGPHGCHGHILKKNASSKSMHHITAEVLRT